jgi:hypothetical protein
MRIGPGFPGPVRFAFWPAASERLDADKGRFSEMELLPGLRVVGA